MKLLTKELENKLPDLYTTEEEPIKKVIAHYFSPYTSWDWYAVEGSWITDTDDPDFLFFGYVEGQFNEWGFFSLSSLNVRRGKLQLVERDLYWEPKWIFVGCDKLYDTREKAETAYHNKLPQRRLWK